MLRIIFYATVLLCTFVTQSFAQDVFEKRAKEIALRIEQITKSEKEALKKSIDSIDDMVSKGKMTTIDADGLKLKLATQRAQNIETKVAQEEEKLRILVSEVVDGKIENSDSDSTQRKRKFTITWNEGAGSYSSKYEKRSEKRTTSQFVFAFGLNNLVTDGDWGSLEDSDFRVWGSHFYEWGLTYNTRIFKNNNLLHAKYGLSLMYNNLRPTDNRYFVRDGNQTNLQEFDLNLRESRFRNVLLVAPVHLEFDFTPTKQNDKGERIFKSHRNVRLGIGGYAGFNVKTKQILKFTEDDIKVKVKEKGDFNSTDFVYGLSTYIGYGETSLYLKYDLNPLFKNNAIDQNNISLGVRFDLN